MLDMNFLPTNTGVADIQIFNRPSTITNLQWYTWRKPRGKSMCNIFALSGGGGGGGGFGGIVGAARGGGASGGCSGSARVTIPLVFLPDTLYIQVGPGGNGGASNTAGSTLTPALNSFVSIYPDTSATNVLLASGTNVPTGGGAGTAAAGGTAGSVPTVATIGIMPLAGLGHFDLIVGIVGVAGGSIANPGVVTAIPATSALCMPGSGGGGCTGTAQAGGGVTAIASSHLSMWAPVAAAAGVNGSPGPLLWKPFFSYGGLGGGSSNATTGGEGGYGAYGSGGGGGGAGTAAAGRGGDGGNGLVIITCW